MKKFLIIAISFFCLCQIAFAKTYNLKADNSDVNLNKSDIITIELSENPSTGFLWEFQSSDEEVAKIINKRLVYPPTPKGQPPLCGQGGTAIYKIKAVGKGKATISGVYHRPWGKNPSAKKYTIFINVN